MVVVLFHAVVPGYGEVLVLVDEPVNLFFTIGCVSLLFFFVWHLVAQEQLCLVLQVSQKSILLLLSQIWRRFDHIDLDVL